MAYRILAKKVDIPANMGIIELSKANNLDINYRQNAIIGDTQDE